MYVSFFFFFFFLRGGSGGGTCFLRIQVSILARGKDISLRSLGIFDLHCVI